MTHPVEKQSQTPAVTGGFNVPIALFNFNRPKMTRQVFDVVRQVKPRRLLLVADGPRESKPEDAQLCAEVREIFDEIDWDCEVIRNFSDANLGSFQRNSSGLNWVFENVEEAIILEDDCVPSLSFFPYCEALLDRYRHDPGVGLISGNNFGFPDGWNKGQSYFFSAYSLTWGWATWRRAWREVDLAMSWWEPEAGRELLCRLFPQRSEWQYWYELYENIRLGRKRNAWDYQMLLTFFRHSQCCVIPRVNLVSNIGFGSDATNCVDENSPMQNLPRKELAFPLRHPADAKRSAKVDHAIFRMAYHPRVTTWRRAINTMSQHLKWAQKNRTRLMKKYFHCPMSELTDK